MKKILISSFHYEINYGALLQAFALQKSCRLFGYNTSHNDFIPKFYSFYPYYLKKNILICIYHWIKRCYFIYIKKNAPWKNIINSSFNELLRSPLKLSTKADILITGSDQVWNHNFIWGREKIYFLGFGKASAKRISYAASLGVSSWPKSFEKKVLPYLNKFNAISVREESSVTYLNTLGFKNVTCVCDPTILHNSFFYRKNFKLNSKTDISSPFIYRIRTQVPREVSYILPSKFTEIVLRDPNNKTLVTEWLSYIDNASFVVTDSFHCAVFCILFHKPFLVLPNQSTGKGMNERFSTLLGKTNLEYRVLSGEENSEEILKKLNTPVDWNKIDSILEEWRNFSANWLKNALEK